MTGSYLHSTRLLLLLVIFSIGLFHPHKAIAQSREYLLKAGYVEKFTHFVEWPEPRINKDSLFRIAVIGDSKWGKALEEIFRRVKVKDKPVKITYISNVDEIKNCMILVISGSTNNKIEEILKYTTGQQVLTISDGKDYGKKGVIINLIVVDNLIKFEINRKSLDKSKLKISSLLLNSAIIINTNE